MNCALKAEDIVILLCQLPFVLDTIISGFGGVDCRKDVCHTALNDSPNKFLYSLEGITFFFSNKLIKITIQTTLQLGSECSLYFSIT